jgi:hypothetical protein
MMWTTSDLERSQTFQICGDVPEPSIGNFNSYFINSLSTRSYTCCLYLLPAPYAPLFTQAVTDCSGANIQSRVDARRASPRPAGCLLRVLR